MDEQPAGPEPQRGDRFAYFMVRIQDDDSETRASPSGIVERLGSGQKRAFSGVDELVRLLTEAPGAGVQDRRAQRRRQ